MRVGCPTAFCAFELFVANHPIGLGGAIVSRVCNWHTAS